MRNVHFIIKFVKKLKFLSFSNTIISRFIEFIRIGLHYFCLFHSIYSSFYCQIQAPCHSSFISLSYRRCYKTWFCDFIYKDKHRISYIMRWYSVGRHAHNMTQSLHISMSSVPVRPNSFLIQSPLIRSSLEPVELRAAPSWFRFFSLPPPRIFSSSPCFFAVLWV